MDLREGHWSINLVWYCFHTIDLHGVSRVYL